MKLHKQFIFILIFNLLIFFIFIYLGHIAAKTNLVEQMVVDKQYH